MRKSKFSESQIMGILAEGEAGLPVGEVCRKHGISSATYYQWKGSTPGSRVQIPPSRPSENKGLGSTDLGPCPLVSGPRVPAVETQSVEREHPHEVAVVRAPSDR